MNNIPTIETYRYRAPELFNDQNAEYSVVSGCLIKKSNDSWTCYGIFVNGDDVEIEELWTSYEGDAGQSAEDFAKSNPQLIHSDYV